MTLLNSSRRWIITGFVFLVIIALIAFSNTNSSPAAEMLPDAPLYDLQGEVVALEPHQAKIIHLWRGNCDACLQNMALLEQIAQSEQYPNVSVYFLNTGDELGRVRLLSEGKSWQERVLSDPSGQWVELTNTLPGTLFFDAENRLRFIEGELIPGALGIGILERYLKAISS